MSNPNDTLWGSVKAVSSPNMMRSLKLYLQLWAAAIVWLIFTSLTKWPGQTAAISVLMMVLTIAFLSALNYRLQGKLQQNPASRRWSSGMGLAFMAAPVPLAIVVLIKLL